jgi:hypothetical protein
LAGNGRQRPLAKTVAGRRRIAQSFFRTVPDFPAEEEEDLEEALEPLRVAVLRGALMDRGVELRDEEGRETADLPEEDGTVLVEPDLEAAEAALEGFDTEPVLGAGPVRSEGWDALELNWPADRWPWLRETADCPDGRDEERVDEEGAACIREGYVVFRPEARGGTAAEDPVALPRSPDEASLTLDEAYVLIFLAVWVVFPDDSVPFLICPARPGEPGLDLDGVTPLAEPAPAGDVLEAASGPVFLETPEARGRAVPEDEPEALFRLGKVRTIPFAGSAAVPGDTGVRLKDPLLITEGFSPGADRPAFPGLAGEA